MSRLARYLMLDLKKGYRAFPANPMWAEEMKAVAAYIFAGADEQFFADVDAELFGE